MIPTSPDILVPILDYLDSPTLMDCREISKDFLKIIDDHPYLWSFFYLPEHGKRYSHKMFKLFLIKSKHRFRGVDINVELPGIYAKSFTRILLSSTRSLRLCHLAEVGDDPDWEYEDESDMGEEEDDWEDSDEDSDKDDYSSEEEEEEEHEFEEDFWQSLPDQIRNLRYIQSFRYLTSGWEQKPTLKLKDGVDGKAVRTCNPENGCSLVELHLAYGYNYFRLYYLLHWSCGSLKYLSLRTGEMPNSPLFKFPNLVAFQWRGAGGPNGILEMPKWLTESSNLKVVHFITVPGRIVYLGNLPISIERIWISNFFESKRGDQLFSIVAGLHRLVIFCPRLEYLRIEGLGIMEKDVLCLLKTRQKLIEQGVQIDGIPNQRIKKLTLDTSLVDVSALEEIRALVEEVEDVFDAPEVLEIEC